MALSDNLFRNAKTTAEAISVFDALKLRAIQKYPNSEKKSNKAIAVYQKKLDVRLGQLGGGGSTGTVTNPGPITNPTLGNLYDELKKQALQLVGLGQQVQTQTGITPTAPKSSGGFDWSTLLLLGGGALAVFYFFRNR